MVLNYIAVSEATRRRIDNGDCKRVSGFIKAELWVMDDNNVRVRRISRRTEDMLFIQLNKTSPPPIAISYYQDDRAAAAHDVMNTVTYNVPEDLLNSGRIMLLVIFNLSTRHKDNDFATYDMLKMKDKEFRRSFILRDIQNSNVFTIKENTIENNSYTTGHNPMEGILEYEETNADDTHFIWIHLTCKRK